MNYLLNNKNYEIIIICFLLINTIFTIILSLTETIKKLNNKSSKLKNKENKEKGQKEKSNIYIIKYIIISSWFLTFLCIFVSFIIRNKYVSNLSNLFYLPFFYYVYKCRKQNINELTYENKIHYIEITYVYLMLFSTKAIDFYIKFFSNLPHIIKEYMLIIFLIIKLLYFIFCVIINLSILISYIKAIFKRAFSILIKNYKKILHNYITFKFPCSKNGENKKFLIFDILIYLLLCPFLIIINGLIYFFSSIIEIIIKRLLIVKDNINFYLNNSVIIIKKTIETSIIISLTIIYFFIIYSPNLISGETKEIYILLTTVILIPLIYDNIKEK